MALPSFIFWNWFILVWVAVAVYLENAQCEMGIHPEWDISSFQGNTHTHTFTTSIVVLATDIFLGWWEETRELDSCSKPSSGSNLHLRWRFKHTTRHTFKRTRCWSCSKLVTFMPYFEKFGEEVAVTKLFWGCYYLKRREFWTAHAIRLVWGISSSHLDLVKPLMSWLLLWCLCIFVSLSFSVCVCARVQDSLKA